MDDFDVPRTPKRRHSTSSKRTGIHIDDKNIVFANPFRTPRKMELVRRDYPRAEAETCPPCHPSCEPELVHSLSTSELAQSHSQATRSAGILPRLRNKYQVSASTEALSSTTTAEATELPSISDALPPTASIASHSAPASTFLKSTFLKMFSKNTSDGSTITESRSTSRHGVRRVSLSPSLTHLAQRRPALSALSQLTRYPPSRPCRNPGQTVAWTIVSINSTMSSSTILTEEIMCSPRTKPCLIPPRNPS